LTKLQKGKEQMNNDDFEATYGEVDENGGAATMGDFDLDAEFKPEPLIPGGKGYKAAVKSVKVEPKANCITWSVVLHDNDVLASDGVTSVDGMELWFRNWLPKPGDENEFSKSGKATKRQSKINMLTKFAQKMKINMGTPQIIAQAISEGEWIGLEVIVEIQLDDYKGEVKNIINSMVAA
jgi:hypothetical protein